MTDIEVSGFSLFNLATNTAVRAITPGEALDLDALETTFGTRAFTVVCDTTGPVESGEITYEYNTGDASSAADATYDGFPFPLPDNQQLAAGSWVVTCEPFCEDGAQGASGGETQIEFTVEELDCSECKTACIAITGMFRFRSGSTAD